MNFVAAMNNQSATAVNPIPCPLTAWQKSCKRSFDLLVSFCGLILTSPLIGSGWLAAALSTRNNGFFWQTRIGRDGKPFRLLKLRTMRAIPGPQTNVTTTHDPRITKVGAFLRRSKIDELPQLVNVLLGQMSLVGPRPDVSGFADELKGEDRVVLSIRPGITGPASIEFRNEENLLAEQEDPEAFNRNTIWPRKVALNREYVENWSFRRDLALIFQTVFG